MNLDFTQIVPDIPYILQGIPTTLLFALLSTFFGFLWGTVLSLFKVSSIKPLFWFGTAYTSIFRGTPLLVQIILIYNATPQLIGFTPTELQAGVFTFTLNSSAYISEAIRAGILAVDKGQREAAMSLGVPYRWTMRDIILPQAFKNILPALANESITLLKDTAQVSTIGVLEVLRRAQTVAAKTFRYFEPLLIAAIVYYVLIMLLTIGATVLERRLRRSD